jgi:copper transport protein
MVVICGAIFTATPAMAHAELLIATPSPGVGISQAPGAAVLKFSEPLNRNLSRIHVFDQSGRDVAKGATLTVEGDAQAMERKLGLMQPGVYTVEWTTVSSVDGHTLQGSYSFGIGTATAGRARVKASPVDSEGWLGLIGRFAALTGLALWAGSVFTGGTAHRAGVAPSRLRVLQRGAPLVAFLGTALSIVSSALVSTGSLSGIQGVLLTTRSGRLRLVELVAAGVASLVAPGYRAIQEVLAPISIVAEAASGHAAATSLPLVATASFAVHLAAVGVWVFAIAASALTRESLWETLSTFTPYAVGAAVIVAVTGVTNAVLEFRGLGISYRPLTG